MLKSIQFVKNFNTQEVCYAFVEFEKIPSEQQVLKELSKRQNKNFVPDTLVIYPYCFGFEFGYKAVIFDKKHVKENKERIKYGFVDEVEGFRKVIKLTS